MTFTLSSPLCFYPWLSVKMGKGVRERWGRYFLPCHYRGLWKIPFALVARACKHGALYASCRAAELAITTLTLLEMTSPCTSHLPPVAMTTHHPDHAPHLPKVWVSVSTFSLLPFVFLFFFFFHVHVAFIVSIANWPILG